MSEAQKPLSSSRYAMSSSESDSAGGEVVALRIKSVQNQLDNSQTQTGSRTSAVLAVLVPAKLLHHLLLRNGGSFKDEDKCDELE